jgi:hypothetical protein
VKARDDSIHPVPTTEASPVEPTSDAEIHFHIEKYKKYKGGVAVRLPGQRAGLLIKIVLIFGIVTSAPLLIWATHVAMTAEQVLTALGLQLFALLLVGAVSRRGRK